MSNSVKAPHRPGLEPDRSAHRRLRGAGLYARPRGLSTLVTKPRQIRQSVAR